MNLEIIMHNSLHSNSMSVCKQQLRQGFVHKMMFKEQQLSQSHFLEGWYFINTNLWISDQRSQWDAGLIA